MPEPLKNMYSLKFFEGFTGILQEILPRFNKKEFLNEIFNADWEKKELKQRIRHIATEFGLMHVIVGEPEMFCYSVYKNFVILHFIPVVLKNKIPFTVNEETFNG